MSISGGRMTKIVVVDSNDAESMRDIEKFDRRRVVIRVCKSTTAEDRLGIGCDDRETEPIPLFQ